MNNSAPVINPTVPIVCPTGLEDKKANDTTKNDISFTVPIVFMIFLYLSYFLTSF